MLEFEIIWDNICKHAGEPFQSKRGHPFTYEIASGSVIRVIRPTFERNVSHNVFEEAYSRGLPMDGPGEINDLQAPAFVWAILHDRRIVPGRKI